MTSGWCWLSCAQMWQGTGSPQDLGILQRLLQNGLSKACKSTSDCCSSSEAQGRAHPEASCRKLMPALSTTPAPETWGCFSHQQEYGALTTWGSAAGVCEPRSDLHRSSAPSLLFVYMTYQCSFSGEGIEQFKGNVPLCSGRPSCLLTPSCQSNGTGLNFTPGA